MNSENLGKLEWNLGDKMKKTSQVNWSRNYAALLEYGKKYGTYDVPLTFGIYECDLPNMGDDGGNFHYSSNLAKWLEKQRISKVKHQQPFMPAEHEAKLQKLVDEGKYHSIYKFFLFLFNLILF